MREVPLNQFPHFTPWVHRLLGIEHFDSLDRSIEKVKSEYDQDKYLKCLEYYERFKGNISPEEVKKYEFGISEEDEVCISKGEQLYLASLREVRLAYYKTLTDTMHSQIQASDFVVELGCGYGFNLYMLSRIYPTIQFVGGEYSQNAVRLAESLFENSRNINVEHFNFYDSDYKIFQNLKGRFLVFTSHAIEQIPFAKQIITNLRNNPVIQAVFHFEPTFELYRDTTLLGLMRKRYTV